MLLILGGALIFGFLVGVSGGIYIGKDGTRKKNNIEEKAIMEELSKIKKEVKNLKGLADFFNSEALNSRVVNIENSIKIINKHLIKEN